MRAALARRYFSGPQQAFTTTSVHGACFERPRVAFWGREVVSMFDLLGDAR
jgi:hypothetical protein